MPPARPALGHRQCCHAALLRESELDHRADAGYGWRRFAHKGEEGQPLSKASRTAAQARDAILGWRDAFPLIETSEDVIVAAAELSASHRIGFWDAVILASASEGGCRLLLTEDLQEGFTWNGVTVTNPFAKSQHPLLRDLLR